MTDLLRHFDLDLGVVRIGVQHDDRIGQHIRNICTLEGIWVAADVSLRKLLHEPINLLCFPRQPEAVQECPDSTATSCQHVAPLSGDVVVLTLACLLL